MPVKVKHLLPKPQQRLLQSLLRSNLLEDTEYEDSDIEIVDLDLHRGYARPRLESDSDEDDEELSDYVKFRLLLARTLAMKKYYEVNSKAG